VSAAHTPQPMSIWHAQPLLLAAEQTASELSLLGNCGFTRPRIIGALQYFAE